MPILPLYHLARKACIKNIKCKYENNQLQGITHICIAITDVGDIPYELIRPVLIKLENPDQLVNSSITSFMDVILTNGVERTRESIPPALWSRRRNMARVHQAGHPRMGEETTRTPEPQELVQSLQQAPHREPSAGKQRCRHTQGRHGRSQIRESQAHISSR